MTFGNPTDSINVIVESGGSFAEPDDYRLIDFTTVKRLQIKDYEINELYDLGEKNMGLPSTLSDFLVWGIQSYPAEKYVLVLWNHGSGINGYGNDDVSNDHLTLDELKTALD